jgi:hypothetical protein
LLGILIEFDKIRPPSLDVIYEIPTLTMLHDGTIWDSIAVDARDAKCGELYGTNPALRFCKRALPQRPYAYCHSIEGTIVSGYVRLPRYVVDAIRERASAL